MSEWAFDPRAVRQVRLRDGADYDTAAWPYSLPPVAHLLTKGLELDSGVTFLVGGNGSGKSTLIEALAAAAGLNPEGGSRNARHSTKVTESRLHEVLQLVRSVGPRGWSYFLRAETMHGHYTYLDELPGAAPSLHEFSHGESILEVLENHLRGPGFYLLDEPESALSFSSCLALLVLLDEVARGGGQVVCATHSPVLSALPGATILELSEQGIRRVEWADLELVDHWRRFLGEPYAYLRHLLG